MRQAAKYPINWIDFYAKRIIKLQLTIFFIHLSPLIAIR